MTRFLTVGLVLMLAVGAFAGPPVPADDRLAIDLIAQEPALVTPTGIACDVRDNVWVIESNTHFPPKNYTRHTSDQLWVFSGVTDRPATQPAATRPAMKQTLFADGFQQAMSLALTPKGRVYVVCRNEIVLLEDKNHDLKPDGPAKTLVKLDTKATYPHNGLNGIVLSPDGEYLYFCLGLNAGYDYSVIGSDGSKVSGGQEGGSIWRCTPDGGKVEKVAFGFWNCHDLTFDAFGRLFAVDNDPDDIGPCRLLDIIEGGDYGWHFKNGRKGVHPFTSWNGELPGTLPMVSGTGEAPSGILAYESDGLPDDYRGQLLVTSWGDHVIQRFTLKEKGASFESRPVEMIRGGEDFRPVGIAHASDGSVFVTDWVDKSYTLHGKGKLWRIRAKKPATDDGPRADQLVGKPQDELLDLLENPKRELRVAAADALVAMGRRGVGALGAAYADLEHRRAWIQSLWTLRRLPEKEFRPYLRIPIKPAELRGEAIRSWSTYADLHILVSSDLTDPKADRYSTRQVILYMEASYKRELLENRALLANAESDPFIAAAIIRSFSKNEPGPAPLNSQDPATLFRAIAMRVRGGQSDVSRILELIDSANPAIRRLALQWVGEDRLTQFAPNIADALKGEGVNRDLLAAYLACREKLATVPPEPGKPPVERSSRQFAAEYLFDEKNALPLRRIALDLIDPADPKLPAKKLIALIEPMGIDAIKALAWRGDDEAQVALRTLAADDQRDSAFRKEAISGLARSALNAPDTKKTLVDLLFSAPPELRTDALRSLRGTLSAEDGKHLVAELLAAAQKPDLGTDADKQEWAEQVLLAFKPNPDALGPAERQQLAALIKSRPATTADWQKAIGEGGDVENGRRLFSLSTGGRCFVCHQMGERGGVVGPNLGRIASAMDRNKIIESILEPSKEIAPLYVPVVVELKDGRTLSGIPQNEAGAGNFAIADATGQKIRINADDIVSRRPEKISIMPEGMAETMTVREFQDLVAYLAQSK